MGNNTLIDQYLQYLLVALLTLVCHAQPLSAQSDGESAYALFIQGIQRNGQIQLRWAPNNYITWKQCRNQGVVLEKYLVAIDGKTLPVAQRSNQLLAASLIKPEEDENIWAELAERDDNGAIAAQAMFGTSFQVVDPSATGSSLSALIDKAEDQDNRFSFGLFAADQSYEVATTMGLAYTDTNLQPGATYLYRLYAGPGTTFEIDTAFVTVAVNAEYQLPKITELKAEFSDKQVLISWNSARAQGVYSNYRIERSADGLSYASISESPFVSLTPHARRGPGYSIYVDTLPQNGTPYFYRISGRSIFGEYGPVSDLVQGMGVDPLPNYAPSITTTVEEDQSIKVVWKYPEEGNARIAGFQLLRGDTPQGKFTIIGGAKELINASERFFIDTSPLPSNYYKIVAVDRFGRRISSFEALAQLNDQTPPSAPTDVRGKVMEDGRVVLTWKSNTEADLFGYRVYFGNHENGDFAQVTSAPVTNNFYVDTVSLNNLNKYVYFKLRAVDFRRNKSAFSAPVALSRPDTIPPAAAAFKLISPSDNSVLVKWANSSSADLARHELQRRTKKARAQVEGPGSESAGWETIFTRESTEITDFDEYRDQLVTPGITYEYRVVAFDDDDLSTPSQKAAGGAIDNGIRPNVVDLTATADRRARTVTLEWRYAVLPGLLRFEIYRGEGNERPTVISQQEVNAGLIPQRKAKGNKRFRFVDEGPKMNTKYTYRIRAVYMNGAMSGLGSPAIVNY